MDDIKDRFIQLLQKDSLSVEEQKWMIEVLQSEYGSELESILYQYFERTDFLRDSSRRIVTNADELLESIHEKAGINAGKSVTIRKKLWKRTLVAASLLVAVLSVTYILFRPSEYEHVVQSVIGESEIPAGDVKPGGNKAILQLADGSILDLEKTNNGQIASQGGAMVIKSGDKLNYKVGEDKQIGNAYNTISTPRGGQYYAELSDGTKVWLNSASSIRFPVFFQGNERKVEITGEVYFEVVARTEKGSGKKIPFVVKVNKPGESAGEVTVYGTQFNIMSYPDERQVQTTLVEGSVAYRNGMDSVRLKPGQQSTFSRTDGIKVSEVTKLDEVISWKNGFFHFEGSEPEFVLRKLSRWYNVDVVFKRKINDKFYADIPMNTMLSDALKALELTGVVHFIIENDKIIVN